MMNENVNSEKENLSLDNPDFTELLYKTLFIPKPFGIIWNSEKMEDFLKFKGYKILKRVDEITGKPMNIAIKPEAKFIPNEKSNILELFELEVQDTILNWLKSISK